MKKEKWVIATAAGAGVAAIAYALLSKNSIPDNTPLVQPFDAGRYAGLWYEVARLPNFIEKNIKDLTEEYILNDDGSIQVITKGYNVKKEKWVTFTGKAKSAGDATIGKLLVSYLGPFYLDYNILDVDANYQYALVSGSSLNYLWILSRQTTISEEIKTRFLNKALEIGFEVDKLEWM